MSQILKISQIFYSLSFNINAFIKMSNKIKWAAKLCLHTELKL